MVLTVTAAELFVQCLAQYGVKEIYGVPGEANPQFMLALVNYNNDNKNAMPFFTVRHEQAAAFMAYGTSVTNLRNGKNVPGVCLSTEGPGATNLLTGLACAQVDHVPLIVITGQAAQNKNFKRGFQVIDVVEVTKPVTKWSVSITNPDNVPQVLAHAFQLALTPPYGVVHIELPLDVAKVNITKPLGPLEIDINPKFTFPDTKHIDKAYQLIKTAKNPVFLVGPDLYVRLSGDNVAWKVLRDLVKKTNIGVVVAPGGKGALPADSDLFLYALNFPPDDFANIALETSDLIISVGYDVAELATEAWNQGEVGIAEVVGDIGATLSVLLQKVNEDKEYNRVISPFYKKLRDAFQKTLQYTGEVSQTSVFQGTIVNEAIGFMKDNFKENAVVVLDSGFHQIWTLRNGDMDYPFNLISSNSMASMGVGLPAALGAARANSVNNEKKGILLISGDGGFLMNMQDMATLKKFTDIDKDVKIVVLVWNDSALGFVQWAEQTDIKTHADVSFYNPDFQKLGDCFKGWCGLPEITKTEQIKQSLHQAFFQHQESVLLSVKVDPEQNIKFSDYLAKEIKEFKQNNNIRPQANAVSARPLLSSMGRFA